MKCKECGNEHSWYAYATARVFLDGKDNVSNYDLDKADPERWCGICDKEYEEDE